MTVGRDLATNVAPSAKGPKKLNKSDDGSATNVAPTLPDGERAGKLVVGRENRKARDHGPHRAKRPEAPEKP